jgi:hypothetical protein
MSLYFGRQAGGIALGSALEDCRAIVQGAQASKQASKTDSIKILVSPVRIHAVSLNRLLTA